MFRVTKIEIPNSRRFIVKLNSGYQLLSIIVENNIPYLYISTNTGNSERLVTFFTLREQDIILEPQYMKYIDSYQVLDTNREAMIYHLFTYNQAYEQL